MDSKTNDERERQRVLGIIDEPQPEYDTVEVDAGTSSAVHELELDEAMEESPEPENQRRDHDRTQPQPQP